ncbi:hypothetical protein NIES2104_63120 [Leptolyngbya sp. NIES-2104]|nr:hypothetical protein NIES2104_63120 [Leptolyngbya sp. NIES-2104]
MAFTVIGRLERTASSNPFLLRQSKIAIATPVQDGYNYPFGNCEVIVRSDSVRSDFFIPSSGVKGRLCIDFLRPSIF